jgi:hypothetical protein
MFEHTITKYEEFPIEENNNRYGNNFKKSLVGKSYTEAKAMVLAYTRCPARQITTYYSTDSWVKEMNVYGAHSSIWVVFDKKTRKVRWAA